MYIIYIKVPQKLRVEILKKLHKNYIKWIIVLLLLVLVGSAYSFNWYDIKDKTVDKISSISIPFYLIVNPKNVDQGITPKSISINTKDYSSDKSTALDIVDRLNDEYKKDKSLDFLSTKQRKSLMKKINKTPHQYIYKITLLNFGKDLTDKYVTISLNQRNDTKNIVSYRYRVYYQKNEVTSSTYLTTTSNKYPPRFVIPDIELGNAGVYDSKPFVQRIKTAIINSNLSMNNASQPGDFNQIAINLGLNTDKSNKGLYTLAKNSNTRVTNFAIIGYEISDVPRSSRIFIKQLSKDNSYYYTLTYNRNSQKFVSFQNGIISTYNQN